MLARGTGLKPTAVHDTSALLLLKMALSVAEAPKSKEPSALLAMQLQWFWTTS
jgi:hypothetical protein